MKLETDCPHNPDKPCPILVNLEHMAEVAPYEEARIIRATAVSVKRRLQQSDCPTGAVPLEVQLGDVLDCGNLEAIDIVDAASSHLKHSGADVEGVRLSRIGITN